MAEWHDSFVFEEVRKKLQPHCLNWGQGIIRGEGHLNQQCLGCIFRSS